MLLPRMALLDDGGVVGRPGEHADGEDDTGVGGMRGVDDPGHVGARPAGPAGRPLPLLSRFARLPALSAPTEKYAMLEDVVAQRARRPTAPNTAGTRGPGAADQAAADGASEPSGSSEAVDPASAASATSAGAALGAAVAGSSAASAASAASALAAASSVGAALGSSDSSAAGSVAATGE